MGYQACFIASYPAHLRGRRALPRDTAQLGLPGRCGQPGSSPAPWLAQKRWLQAGSKTIRATSNEGRAAKRSITCGACGTGTCSPATVARVDEHAWIVSCFQM
jgi:hypothetical protein